MVNDLTFSRIVGADKIVGGNFTELGELPYQVFLTTSDQFLCGGALLSSLLVVTAAHCLGNIRTNSLRIIAGTNDRGLLLDSPPTEQIRSARFVYSHDNFDNKTLDNDIALIALSSPLRDASHIGQVTLPREGEEFTNLTLVSGWGLTEDGGFLSTLLRKISIPFVSKEECGRQYAPRRRPITHNMLCAVGEGRDSCNGDSGGPAVCTRDTDSQPDDDNSTLILCGIVSFGDGCARPEIPGVYTRVANYVSWITETMGKISNRRPPCSTDCVLHQAVMRHNTTELSQLIRSEPHILHERNKDSWTPLHTVIDIKNSTEAVKMAIHLLGKGADAFAQDWNGNSFLHLLLYLGKMTPADLDFLAVYLVETKLRTLFSVKGGPYQATPLLLAVGKMEVEEETLQLLLRSKANFRAEDFRGDNVLAYAIMGRRSLTMMKELIRLRVVQKHKNRRGENLLHIAAKSGNPPAAEFLIKRGLDVNSRDKHGYTALHHLVQTGTRNVVRMARFLVCAGANVTARNRWGESPADVVTALEDAPLKDELLQLLERAKTKPIVNPKPNGDPLSIAEGGKVDATEKTLQASELDSFTGEKKLGMEESLRGARRYVGATSWPSPSSSSPTPPTTLASPITSSTIYPANFNVNKKDSNRNTELHLAAERGDEAAVIELVQVGANSNAKNRQKKGPLHLAASMAAKTCGSSNDNSCLNVIDFLIEHGANVYARDKEGRTFLHLLLGHPNTTVTPTQLHRIAEKYGHLFNIPNESGTTALHFALGKIEMNPSTLALLQGKGANFKAVNNHGYTVLVSSVIGNQSTQVLSKLIEFGTDYTQLDDKNRSVLHWAAYFANVKALTFFILKEGLNVNGKDNQGRTALHVAGENSKSNALEVARLLLDNGADKTIEDAQGNSPYDRVKNWLDFPTKKNVLELLR